MLNQFTVTQPATNPSLLSAIDLREIAQVDDGSADVELALLGRRISALIANFCQVASDGINPPTLRKERCREIIRRKGARGAIRLSRRPVVSIVSVTVNNVIYPAPDYEVDAATGLLSRMSNGREAYWSANDATIVYDAGFDRVPDDLVLAALRFAGSMRDEFTRDSTLKREEIPGLLEREWWVNPPTEEMIGPDVAEMLGRYRNYWGI